MKFIGRVFSSHLACATLCLLNQPERRRTMVREYALRWLTRINCERSFLASLRSSTQSNVRATAQPQQHVQTNASCCQWNSLRELSTMANNVFLLCFYPPCTGNQWMIELKSLRLNRIKITFACFHEQIFKRTSNLWIVCSVDLTTDRE